MTGLIAGLEYHLWVEGAPSFYSLLKFTVRSGKRLDKGTLRPPFYGTAEPVSFIGRFTARVTRHDFLTLRQAKLGRGG